jgi:hypothetical protein
MYLFILSSYLLSKFTCQNFMVGLLAQANPGLIKLAREIRPIVEALAA